MSRAPGRPENGLLWEVPGDPQPPSTGATPAGPDGRIAALLRRRSIPDGETQALNMREAGAVDRAPGLPADLAGWCALRTASRRGAGGAPARCSSTLSCRLRCSASRVDGTSPLSSDRAEGKYDRLPGLAAELVRLKVNVLVAGSQPAIQAAKHATEAIPIVMVAADLVAAGFVASLARPGGNITGLSMMSAEVIGKQLEMQDPCFDTRALVTSSSEAQDCEAPGAKLRVAPDPDAQRSPPCSFATTRQSCVSCATGSTTGPASASSSPA
jgi:hypothetical protein